MAVLRLDYVSSALKTQTRLVVCHPFADRIDAPPPRSRVLVLLHGMLDGADTWLTQTRIHRLARELGVVVAMPDGQRSFWRDLASGGRFESLVTEELPTLLGDTLGLAHDRDQWVIAGNSMGGYGALRCSLRSPEVFGHCIALSPVVDPVQAARLIPDEYLIPGEYSAVFDHAPEPDEILELACGRGADVGLSLSCGARDFLYAQTDALHEAMQARGRNHRLSVDRDAMHSWDFWDPELSRLLPLVYR